MAAGIRILAVGKTRARFVELGVEEYLKRLQSYARTELVVLPAAKVPPRLDPAAAAAVKEAEGRAILGALLPGEYLIALSEHGQEVTSEGFAALMERLALHGSSRLAFGVGGTVGLDEAVLRAAGTVLSLSRLTFTHELARLILLEQLYRAFRILHHEPYHY
ncbi:MAG TPA: 23S rRNA (pseudouridine(1915)-N(3))-methyltransferase RlmH [Firmicutes bacterium]|nr:23S rRNA (pseudouridine(1915)-N(3))-methyltransferase RlmH [Bacillota bacterium]